MIWDDPGTRILTERFDREALAGAVLLVPASLAAGTPVIVACGEMAEPFARRLRIGKVSMVGRIERDRVFLDLRTMADAELGTLATAIRQAAA